jgi:hypothetical protein
MYTGGAMGIGAGFNYTLFHLVDSDALIRLESGAYIIKKYNSGATQHTTMEFYGGATFSSSSMTLTVSVGSMNLTTSKYVYPIDGGIGFVLYNGTYTVSNNFKLMPGCTVDVMENAKLIVNSTLAMYNYDTPPGYTGTYPTMNNTKYSSGTTAAQMILHGSSTLIVNGSLGGQVATADDTTASKPATITLASGSTLSTTTQEATDYSTSKTWYGTTKYTISYTSYTFSLALLNADGTASDITPAAGTTYYGYDDTWSDTEPTVVTYLTGDLDNNGAVNVDDLNLLLKNFNKSGPSLVGDIDNNGAVNVDDLNALLKNFNKSVA